MGEAKRRADRAKANPVTASAHAFDFDENDVCVHRGTFLDFSAEGAPTPEDYDTHTNCAPKADNA